MPNGRSRQPFVRRSKDNRSATNRALQAVVIEDMYGYVGSYMAGWVVDLARSYGKLRDELLNREILTTLQKTKVLTEGWRREYNQVRPHRWGKVARILA